MFPLYNDVDYRLAKSQHLLPLKCEHCGKTFYVQKKFITHELTHNRGRLKYCSRKCLNEKNNTSHEETCAYCGKPVIVTHGEYVRSKTKRFFCCKSHATSYNNKLREPLTDEIKQKIRESAIRTWNNATNKHQTRICKVCGKTYHYITHKSSRVFCSKECSEEYFNNRIKYLSPETRQKWRETACRNASLMADIRRSKNEMYFCELCQEHFETVFNNKPMFNGWDADVIIEEYKVAVLWNGIWHYKQIMKSPTLLQVQTRDRLKLHEIINCGYEAYIIKDMGGYDPVFVQQEFEKFLKYIEEKIKP